MDNGHDCPEGQVFDVSQGKCVAKEGFGDPKSQSVQGEIPSGDPGDKPAVVEPAECPEGHKWNAESKVCEPVEAKADKTDDYGMTNTDIAKEVKALRSEIATFTKEAKKPTAQVSNGNTVKTWSEVAEGMKHGLAEYGKYEFDIPLDSLRSINVGKVKEGAMVTETFRSRPLQLREAVSISGTHATQDLDTDVAIVPGGISFKPVFEFAKTKRIAGGADRARFFKTTIPSNGSQTVGTTATEATQTLTSVEVTPSTITGVYLIGDFDEIENSPFDLLQAIVEGSAASFEDFVATDMLDTVSAEGTLTPGLWIRGDTGATITGSDIASVAFDETGIAVGREYLENQGYLRGGIKPVVFVDPQQWRELITSTNVTSLATRSVPDIWLKANLEEFMGVQIVTTNAVEHKSNTTNNAVNALMCIPKHSYGIGIKRDVTVKMHEIPEDNQVRVNTTWRVKSGVIDSTSIVRISTTD